MSSDGTVTYMGTDLEPAMILVDTLTPSHWRIMDTKVHYDHTGEGATADYTKRVLIVRPVDSDDPETYTFIIETNEEFEVREH